jgi:hypothetical protein
VEPPSIRDAARHAEAERYLRASGAKLRFWLSCWLLAPIANVLVWLGTLALVERQGGPPDAVAWLPLVVALTLEAVLLRRLCGIFAPRRPLGYLIGGMAAVVAATMLLWGGVVLVLLATHIEG